MTAYYYGADCLRVPTTHMEGSWKLRTSFLLSEQILPWHQQVLRYLYQDANPWGFPFMLRLIWKQYISFTEQQISQTCDGYAQDLGSRRMSVWLLGA